MTAINFPDSPTDGQEFTAGDRVWIWNNTSEVWQNASGESLPSQDGEAGKYLTTDGTDAFWSTITTDPNPQIFLLMGS
jgi:hypothetical protein